MKTISHAVLVSLLNYDAETGIFTWKQKRKTTRPIGSRAGCLKPGKTGGYRLIRILGVLYREHRLAWFYVTGGWPEDQVDHINGDRADNRFCNLREATNSTNMQNIHRARKDSATGILGITPLRGKFLARIRINGKEKNLGLHETANAAHEAYLAAKRIYHPGCTI